MGSYINWALVVLTVLGVVLSLRMPRRTVAGGS
jgi:hypothetical protein